MPISDDEAKAVKTYCASVASYSFGEVDYLQLSGLQLPGCTPSEVDALLCLGDRGEGYATRLFFSQVIVPPKPFSLNWNASGVRILERNWHAYSWKVPAGLSPSETLAEHLKPLR